MSILLAVQASLLPAASALALAVQVGQAISDWPARL